MRKKLTFFFCLVFLFSTQAWGQTYELSPTMTATFNSATGALTITTTASAEDMPYTIDGENFVWPIYLMDSYGSNWENIRSVIIGNKITSIAPIAFTSCSNLISVNISNSVKTIGQQAFSDCSALTSIAIPNSVTTIGQLAFSDCTGLTSMTIPNSVISVGNYAFNGCTGLTSVKIPNSMTSINEGTFVGCSGLTSVTIPNSITSIGWNVFVGCSGLTSMTIPNSVTNIGQTAFFDCTGLTFINIPNSVTSIGNRAFSSCDALTDVTVDWKTPLSVSADLFDYTNISVATLHVPAGTKTLYQKTPVWKDFGTIDDGSPSIVTSETQTVGTDGKGSIGLNLSIPGDATLTGTFEITFPAGMTLDEELTVLSAGLSNNYFLSFTYEENNKWLVEIKSNALKSSTETEYTKIMDIAYTVNDSLPKGTYEAKITNLNFLQDDGTPIKEDLLTVPITVERWGTAIENIGTPSFYACFIDNSIRIESSRAETITIYSAAGVQLYSTKKNAGRIDISVSSLRGSVYIIKGNKSGTIKVVR